MMQDRHISDGFSYNPYATTGRTPSASGSDVSGGAHQHQQPSETVHFVATTATPSTRLFQPMLNRQPSGSTAHQQEHQQQGAHHQQHPVDAMSWWSNSRSSTVQTTGASEQARQEDQHSPTVVLGSSATASTYSTWAEGSNQHADSAAVSNNRGPSIATNSTTLQPFSGMTGQNSPHNSLEGASHTHHQRRVSIATQSTSTGVSLASTRQPPRPNSIISEQEGADWSDIAMQERRVGEDINRGISIASSASALSKSTTDVAQFIGRGRTPTGWSDYDVASRQEEHDRGVSIATPSIDGFSLASTQNVLTRPNTNHLHTMPASSQRHHTTHQPPLPHHRSVTDVLRAGLEGTPLHHVHQGRGYASHGAARSDVSSSTTPSVMGGSRASQPSHPQHQYQAAAMLARDDASSRPSIASSVQGSVDPEQLEELRREQPRKEGYPTRAGSSESEDSFTWESENSRTQSEHKDHRRVSDHRNRALRELSPEQQLENHVGRLHVATQGTAWVDCVSPTTNEDNSSESHDAAEERARQGKRLGIVGAAKLISSRRREMAEQHDRDDNEDLYRPAEYRSTHYKPLPGNERFEALVPMAPPTLTGPSSISSNTNTMQQQAVAIPLFGSPQRTNTTPTASGFMGNAAPTPTGEGRRFMEAVLGPELYGTMKERQEVAGWIRDGAKEEEEHRREGHVAFVV